MPCVNHPDAAVQAYCQNCGKALCSSCVRTTPSGQVFDEACLASEGGDPSRAYWQAAAQAYAPPPPGSPNPAAAAVLGLIPGVGAMYNGQLFKGLIHVVIFAVLVSITQNYGVFGLFIGAWVLYQSFEAYHTAKARRDGLPLPDPFGLNELGSWLNLGASFRARGRGDAGGPVQGPGPFPGGAPMPGQAVPPAAGAPSGTDQVPPVYTAPYTSSWSDVGGPAGSGPAVPPPYTDPYAGAPPGYVPPGYVPPGYVPTGYGPPAHPDHMAGPPFGWRRKEPVWAVVLIVLGVLFLLKSLGFVGHFIHFAWPVLLIGFGVWLIVRRIGYTGGGSK